MPSVTSREFYANALGIASDGYSLDDLRYRFYNQFSRLPINTGSQADNEYDFLSFKLGIGPEVNRSLNDLRESYYGTLGIGSQKEFEAGVLLARTNLIPNPRAATISMWARQIGVGETDSFNLVTAGDGPSTPGGTPSNYVRRATSVPKTSGSSGTFNRPVPGPVVYPAGMQVIGSMYFRPSVPTTVNSLSLTPRLAGVTSGAASQNVNACAANVWVRLWNTLTTTAPWDAMQVWAAEPSPEVMPADSTSDVVCAFVETGSTLLPYFDGDSPGARWTGTPNASTSQLVTWSA